MKRIDRFILTFTLLIIPAITVVAQDSGKQNPELGAVYSLGDQTLSINGGLFVPLFFQEFTGAVHVTNLTPGGVGSLQWNTYLKRNITLGIEVGGVFAFSPNFNMLLLLPITVKASYIFTYFPFDFPVFLGTGIDIAKYQDNIHVDFMLKPGFSTYWRYNTSWSFGVNTVYWWILQPATGNQPKDEGRMGNFLEISLSALYHF
ncbi:MAG: hypothetical protein DRP57_00925 [Spirochaetes bacterium]|nr:MAG: hypothetical protein DRP57_00925 [Spirochaetota bacterium]